MAKKPDPKKATNDQKFKTVMAGKPKNCTSRGGMKKGK